MVAGGTKETMGEEGLAEEAVEVVTVSVEEGVEVVTVSVEEGVEVVTVSVEEAGEGGDWFKNKGLL